MYINNSINPINIAYTKQKKSPKLIVGNHVNLLFDDTEFQIPDYKNMKKGVYKVVEYSLDDNFDGFIYVLTKENSKSKKIFNISPNAIDKAIELKIIQIII